MKELNGVNMIQELGGDSTLVRKHRNQLMDLILNQIHIQSDRKRCREYGKLIIYSFILLLGIYTHKKTGRVHPKNAYSCTRESKLIKQLFDQGKS